MEFEGGGNGSDEAHTEMGRTVRRADPVSANLPMMYTETELRGAFVVEIEELRDDRGFFARAWCRGEFLDRGLNPKLVQCNISFNRKRGTLRGMHYQIVPCQEAKLVRCTAGGIYDVIIDLRSDSPTFRRWTAVELTAANHRMLYIPEGFAHGFQTLENETEVFYQMSEFHDPDLARGIRWNDPVFNIDWPADERIISPRDAGYPDFNPQI
jgi:dTDP-4-dehydrorhamnose 3,5-epimerase